MLSEQRVLDAGNEALSEDDVRRPNRGDAQEEDGAEANRGDERVSCEVWQWATSLLLAVPCATSRATTARPCRRRRYAGLVRSRVARCAGSDNLLQWCSPASARSLSISEPVALLLATPCGSYLLAGGGTSGRIHTLELPSGNAIRSFPAHTPAPSPPRTRPPSKSRSTTLVGRVGLHVGCEVVPNRKKQMEWCGLGAKRIAGCCGLGSID